MSSGRKSFGLSSSLQEEVMVMKKQGIVSILRSDCERTKSATLRRTLSADMSSKKWLSQHGFSPLKKIASSEEFTVSFSSSSSYSLEEEEETEPFQTQFEIWSSIQQGNNKKEVEKEKPGQFDIWNSILSQKELEPKNLPPPYIHPLVKRSASCLSAKSLEICTERLGSETGSDGFSSYPPSETGDAEDGKEDEQEEEREAENYDVEEDWPETNYILSKKSPPKSFPPPLPSLSSSDGASLHVKARRDNGRLVLEAVSVPSQNNFNARRHDGRLVLSFINNPNEEEAQNNEEKNDMGLFEVEIENFEYGEKEGTTTESETEVEEVEQRVIEKGGGRGESEARLIMEEKPKMCSGVINVHRLALIMNKSIVLANRNPTWPNKFSEEEEHEVEEVVNPITPLTQSLPPRPPVARMIPIPPAAAASSFNAYEYYWKSKPKHKPKSMAAAAALSPITQKPTISNNNKSILSKNVLANERQGLLVLRGNKGDYLVPSSSKGCKEPRRSLLFWEPYCIATS